MNEALTWGRYGSKCANFRVGKTKFSIPIWIGKRYTATPRKRDGVRTWRLTGWVGQGVSGDTTPSTVIRRVKEESKITGVEIKHVRHGQVVE